MSKRALPEATSRKLIPPATGNGICNIAAQCRFGSAFKDGSVSAGSSRAGGFDQR
jgi:hypothetical protein